MSLARRALWIIDRHLAGELTLAGIAEGCGVSRHHLAHAFAAATGQPVMAYVRARRLSEAARALTSGAESILDLALEAGYASHEAFTRAFRGQFGVTPEAARLTDVASRLCLVEPLLLPDVEIAPPPVPQLAHAGPLQAAALRQRYRFGELRTIPGQWRRFAEVLETLRPRLRSTPLGVVTGGHADGHLDYLCAAELDHLDDLPAGLTRLRLRAADYAIFRHDGHVSSLPGTYASVWERWPCERPAADAPLVERHNATFNPATGEGGLTLWVPLA
jgi:AraC family transcriptional regulator